MSVEKFRFSRSLLRNGVPAWQRLQAVRAVETYRNLVLRTDTPSLQTVRLTLSRIADRKNRWVQQADARESATSRSWWA